MHIVFEEQSPENIIQVNPVSVSSGLFKPALLVLTAIIIAVTFVATFVVDRPVSGAFAYEHVAMIGPLDELGQHVYNADPLPNVAAANIQVIYNVDALTIKRMGEKNARDKAEAEKQAEIERVAQEQIVEEENRVAEAAAAEEEARRAAEAEAARQEQARRDAEAALQREVEAAQRRAEA